MERSWWAGLLGEKLLTTAREWSQEARMMQRMLSGSRIASSEPLSAKC
jgi:hypothetical protein